jgi:polysaccharide pyruvyl transferase WcaK-like protein
VSASAVLEPLEATTPSSSGHAPRIGVIYPSGWGNVGDEAILQATFASLRRRWPNAVVRAFTLYPERTAANHSVEAEFLTGVSLPNFLSLRGDGPMPVRAARALARRTQNVPVVRTVFGAAADFLAAMVFETSSIRSAWRWLRTADLLLAAGGGQLDDLWGGAWGQPYALARWAWLSRRAQVPFAFLSVGYGSASSWLSRRLIRYAVDCADYCSVRDHGSRFLTSQLGVEADLPVVPDLAFSLIPKVAGPPRRPGYDIGVSPMAFMRPRSWPKGNIGAYERYVALWADLVTDRVSRGDRVHLFVSDPTDMEAVSEVWSALDAKTREACTIANAPTPDALLDFFRGLDAVVSSRLHGVLLAIVATRPVLALSHERKVRALMNDAGSSLFCLDLATAGIAQVSERLADLTTELESCSHRHARYVTTARAAVREQEEVLSDLLRR